MTPASQPRVSVIVPAYRVTEYISETIESVFAQTYRDFEVIVVNDGCPDTEALERTLAPFLARIRYIRQENRGLAGARNTGIAASAGEYVALLDGDDIWLPNYLESQTKFLDSDPAADVVYCDAVFFGNEQEGRRFSEVCPSRGEVTLKSLISQECFVFVSVLARRSALVAAGGFDERLRSSEDFDMWVRILHRGGGIRYQLEPLVRYRKRPGSLSANDITMCSSHLTVMKKLAALPLSHEEREALDQQVRHLNAKRAWREGQKALREGNAGQALKGYEEANRYYRRLAVSTLVLVLKTVPGVALAASRLRRAWN